MKPPVFLTLKLATITGWVTVIGVAVFSMASCEKARQVSEYENNATIAVACINNGGQWVKSSWTVVFECRK